MGTHLAVHRYPAGARQRHSLGSVDQLRRVDLIAPSTQEALDRITCLAGEALDVPAVCVSLLDAEQRLLTSSYGLALPTALLLSHAFRKQVTASQHPLVVADGRRDPMVARNPAVRDGTVRACVGMPLGTADGRARGTLLAMDQKPRWWTAQQLDLVGTLCALIVGEMELGAAVRRVSQSDVRAKSVPVAERWSGAWRSSTPVGAFSK